MTLRALPVLKVLHCSGIVRYTVRYIVRYTEGGDTEKTAQSAPLTGLTGGFWIQYYMLLHSASIILFSSLCFRHSSCWQVPPPRWKPAIMYSTVPVVSASWPVSILCIGRSNSSCVAFANTMVETFNDALAKSLQSLRANLTGSTIILARADRVLLRILSDPPASGFDKNLDACCGSGTFNGVGPCGVLGYTVCPKVVPHVVALMHILCLLYCGPKDMPLIYS